MAQSILQIILRVTKEGSGERQAAKEAKELKGNLEELGLGSLASASALGILGGAVAMTFGYLSEGMVKAEQGNRVMAKQEQILRATGYAAGLNARELDVMAMSLANLAGIDDDVVRDAQSMLLTFRNIGGDVMPRAAKAVLDLSTTFGGVSQSATQMGKALNDPLAGMTALAKSGVTFTDQQKDMIRGFVAANDLLSAQNIILSEVEMQVGGTAQAMEEASSGSVRLQIAYDNLQSEIATNLLPAQRQWNLSLAETLNNVAEVVVASRKQADINQKVADSLGLSIEQMRRGIAQSAKFAEKVSYLAAVEERAANYAGLTKQQLAALGVQFLNSATDADTMNTALEQNEETLKALSEANQHYYAGVQTMQNIEEQYAQQAEQNAAERIKIEAEKAAYIQQYGTWNVAKIQEFDTALDANAEKARQTADEHEKATRKVILGYMEQKMMADGMLDDKEVEWLLKKGTEWGIYSEKAIEAYQSAMAEADKYINVLHSVPQSINTELLLKITAQGYDFSLLAPGYASGTNGWETVPPGYPNDSYPVFLTSGETFAVIPAGGSTETYGGMMAGARDTGGPESMAVEIRLRDDAERLFTPIVERIMARRR